MRLTHLVSVLVASSCILSASGCLDVSGDAQDTDELEASLPDPDDSKADLSSIDIAGLRKKIDDIVQNFSATTNAKFYATPEAALANIEQTLKASGISNPRSATFVGYLATMPIILKWHHSEFLIRGAVDTTTNKVSKLGLRTVGDPNGAGVFADQQLTTPMSPKICMNWTMLEAAVRASYVDGTYSLDFVCHNDAMRVLRALGIAPEYFQSQIGGWKLARWVYGPRLTSGLPKNPKQWPTTALCENAAVIASKL
jgi:hypothetical protein